MTACRHDVLALLAQPAARVQCTHCKLTISSEELGGGRCPECYESAGKAHYDFEPVDTPQLTRYRCTQCDLVVKL